jgi:hypothetical protein
MLLSVQDDIQARAEQAGMTVRQYLIDQDKRRKARLLKRAVVKALPAPSKPVDAEDLHVDPYRVIRMKMQALEAEAQRAREKWRQECWRESWRQMVWLAATAAMPRPQAQRIVMEVATQTGVSVADIKGDSRTAKCTQPRFYVAWRLQRETALSLPRIGRILGDRDHTTILHAVRRFQSALDACEPWAVTLAQGGKL